MRLDAAKSIHGLRAVFGEVRGVASEGLEGIRRVLGRENIKDGHMSACARHQALHGVDVEDTHEMVTIECLCEPEHRTGCGAAGCFAHLLPQSIVLA